jgi:hypothetical protein
MTAGDSWTDPIIVSGDSGSFTFSPTGSTFYVKVATTLMRGYDFWTGFVGTQWDAYRPDHFWITSSYTSTRLIRGTGGYIWFQVTGSATFAWTSTDPPPDRPYAWDTATVITGTTGSVVYDDIAPDVDERWYSFTPSVGEIVSFVSDETYGYFELYTGASFAARTYVDYGYMPDTPLQFTATGETYHLVIYPQGVPAPETTFTLSWSTSTPPPYIVANDDFSTPVVLDLAAGPIAYDNTGATQGSGTSPVAHTEGLRSIWLSFTSGPVAQGVIFTATPSTADAGRAPTVQVESWHSGSSEWLVESYGIANGAGVELVASTDYMLMLTFPDGDQSLWDAAGQLSWVLSAVPPNTTQGAAVTDTTQIVQIPFAGLGLESRWYTIVQTSPGGMAIVLGDALTPPSTPAPYMVVTVNGDTSGTTVAERTTANPTAGYMRDGKTGDVHHVQVSYYAGSTLGVASSSVMRWGVSTVVTWGPWQSSANTLAYWGPVPYDYWPLAGGYGADALYDVNHLGGVQTNCSAGCSDGEEHAASTEDVSTVPALRASVDSGTPAGLDYRFTLHEADGGHPLPYLVPTVTADGGRGVAVTNNVINNAWQDHVSLAGDLGYTGHFMWQWLPIPATQGPSYAQNMLQVNSFRAQENVYPNPYDGGSFTDNSAAALFLKYQPLIMQADTNGLAARFPTTGLGWGDSHAVLVKAIDHLAVQWSADYGPTNFKVNSYLVGAVNWSRHDTDGWVSPHTSTPGDAMSIQLRNAGSESISSFSAWRSPGDIAGLPIIREWEIPLSSSPSSFPLDHNAVLDADIDLHSYTARYVVNNSMFAGGSLDAQAMVDQQAAAFWGFAVWSETASLDADVILGLVYPSYRIGDYQECLPCMGPGSGNLTGNVTGVAKVNFAHTNVGRVTAPTVATSNG